MVGVREYMRETMFLKKDSVCVRENEKESQRERKRE